MAKIDKNANLYDKDGNLIRKVNENGVLEDYTIPELEQLVDELSKDDDKQAYNNALRVLMAMYNTKKGREYQKRVIDDLVAKAKEKSDKEQALDKLKEAVEDIKPTYNTDTNDAEYVEYEPAA